MLHIRLACALCALAFSSAPVLAHVQRFDRPPHEFDRQETKFQLKQTEKEEASSLRAAGRSGRNSAADARRCDGRIWDRDGDDLDAWFRSGYSDPAVLTVQQDESGTLLYFRFGPGSAANFRGDHRSPRWPTLLGGEIHASLLGDQLSVQLDSDTDGEWDYSFAQSGFPILNLDMPLELTGLGWISMNRFGGYLFVSQAIPEPATVFLLAISAGLLLHRRKGRR